VNSEENLRGSHLKLTKKEPHKNRCYSRELSMNKSRSFNRMKTTTTNNFVKPNPTAYTDSSPMKYPIQEEQPPQALL
jgi:hypothetical protein